MKTSLVMTVYNEGKTIGKQIESILSQTKVPDEVIILDSLSKDNTVKVIKSFKDKRIKIIEKKADIGTGRNIAIESAKNEIILVTDGGCMLESNWVDEMTKPFKDKETNVVGGMFLPLARDFSEKCQGVVVCKDPDKIDPRNFIPSSRSFAFRKKIWKEVGGYPKHEIGGEDTKFVLAIINEGHKIKVNKRAVVYWRMRSPLRNFIRQFYLYARGEVRSGNLSSPILRLVLFTSILFPVYIILGLSSIILSKKLFLIMALIPFFYFLLQGIRVAIKLNDLRGTYYGFVFSFWKRIAYFCGIWAEILSNHKKGYKNENY